MFFDSSFPGWRFLSSVKFLHTLHAVATWIPYDAKRIEGQYEFEKKAYGRSSDILGDDDDDGISYQLVPGTNTHHMGF